MWSFKTLENDKYMPKKISNDTIKLKYTPQNDLGKLITTIEWEPVEGKYFICVSKICYVFKKNKSSSSSDMVCNYFFHLYATKEDTYSALSNRIFRILKVGLKFCEKHQISNENCNRFNILFIIFNLLAIRALSFDDGYTSV